jgi:hypothetical protein
VQKHVTAHVVPAFAAPSRMTGQSRLAIDRSLAGNLPQPPDYVQYRVWLDH